MYGDVVVMGRHAGWIAGAAGLATEQEGDALMHRKIVIRQRFSIWRFG